MKRLLLLGTVIVLFAGFYHKKAGLPFKNDPDFTTLQNRWVDSVFNSLTPNQRLGQLFMVAAWSNKDMKHVKEIKELVVTYNIGGLIWMQGGPVRQGKLANYYQ